MSNLLLDRSLFISWRGSENFGWVTIQLTRSPPKAPPPPPHPFPQADVACKEVWEDRLRKYVSFTQRSTLPGQGDMPADSKMASKKILNFNIGVLGHIDSGKTSLAKALSSTASTASFDKNPQSKERGITLDLGFSSFQVPIPEHLKEHGFDILQFTLVDCPGHASLIRTIIGGAQIIDMMMLVVDVTKGMQTQTAECLVIGEILCEKMVVVLNKTDLLKEDKKQALIEKVRFFSQCFVLFVLFYLPNELVGNKSMFSILVWTVLNALNSHQ